jgi:hypothetical protein
VITETQGPGWGVRGAPGERVSGKDIMMEVVTFPLSERALAQ